MRLVVSDTLFWGFCLEKPRLFAPRVLIPIGVHTTRPPPIHDQEHRDITGKLYRHPAPTATGKTIRASRDGCLANLEEITLLGRTVDHHFLTLLAAATFGVFFR